MVNMHGKLTVQYGLVAWWDGGTWRFDGAVILVEGNEATTLDRACPLPRRQCRVLLATV